VVREKITNLFVLQTSQEISALSYYPGCGDITHTHTPSYPDTENFHNPDMGDHDGETTEEDDDEQMVELALKNSARFSEAMATKVSFFFFATSFNLTSTFTVAHLEGVVLRYR